MRYNTNEKICIAAQYVIILMGVVAIVCALYGIGK